MVAEVLVAQHCMPASSACKVQVPQWSLVHNARAYHFAALQQQALSQARVVHAFTIDQA
jgi:hypothetical protein